MRKLSRLILVLPLLIAASLSAQVIAKTGQDLRKSGTGNASAESLVTISLTDVPLATALKTIATRAGVRVTYDGSVRQSRAVVKMSVVDKPVAEALDLALRNTGFVAVYLPSERAFVVKRAVKAVQAAQGIITGKVADAKTGKSISGANVSVGDGTRGVTTGEDGSYRLTGVAAGTHTVTVRLVGYAKQTRSVTVGEGATLTVDFKLEPSSNVLDQVIVTGTVVATERKAVPNAITVVTAKQIEERGITRIDQLFRGDIPGLFAQNQGSGTLLDEVTMFSRGVTSLNLLDPRTFALTAFTNPIKTYVDGVELADSKYLSQIDPKSIERIEILTGPQASTIYGSNAINGVMQIFTKRGTTSRPQLSLSLLSGWVENNFSSARTTQHDYNAQLNGVEGRLSYNAGGSWNYMGPWTPAKQTARTGGFGGARFELGSVTADVTLRRTITQNRERGDAAQTSTGYRETGWYTNFLAPGVVSPTTRTLTGQTLGLTLGYVPAPWWSHELGWGSDASDRETRVTARGYAFLDDTTLFLSQSRTDRRSFRYTTTARIPVTSLAQATVTAGADAWQNLTSTMSVSPQTLTGTSLTGTTTIARQPGHNTGGFLQTQLGLKDKLFLTYGLRAEWNPNYGDEAQPNYAPRYGVAYTQEVGAMTAKLRGSYGRSTRPPQTRQKVAESVADYYGSTNWSFLSPFIVPYYGLFDRTLTNRELAPEHQQGGEVGLELYLGTRGSLVVTRYNQTVDGLIALPIVDSLRSSVPCAATFECFSESSDVDGYGYLRQSQYLNIGSIRNQGWELQGSVNLGPLTTRGTYSWTKSRTIGVDSRYRAFFANQPQYQPGATFQFLPEHTWALGMTYARSATTVGLNVTGTGRVTNLQDDFYFQNLSSSIRLSQNLLRMNVPSGHVFFNTGYALADLTASHRFASHIEGVLQVQNLTNQYKNDYYSALATLGRQIKFGGRVRLQ